MVYISNIYTQYSTRQIILQLCHNSKQKRQIHLFHRFSRSDKVEKIYLPYNYSAVTVIGSVVSMSEVGFFSTICNSNTISFVPSTIKAEL